jgi:hypothetical protein
VKLKLVNGENKTIGIKNTIIATIETPHSLITGPPGLIQFDKDGIVYIVIQNWLPSEIWSEENDKMEYAEQHIEEVQSEKLDKIFVVSFLHKVSIISVAQIKTHF